MTHQIIDIFPVPLYYEQIDKDLFLNLKQKVLNFIKNNQDKFKNDWDCDTKSNIKTNFLQNPESKDLRDLIILSAKNYLKLTKSQDENIVIDDLWINIASYGAHQESHTHIDHKLNNIFSGVLYISSNVNNGNLVFHAPNKPVVSLFPPPSSYSLSNVKIEPKEGTLLSFPSWLVHEVYPNKSNQDRISVSWNIKII